LQISFSFSNFQRLFNKTDLFLFRYLDWYETLLFLFPIISNLKKDQSCTFDKKLVSNRSCSVYPKRFYRHFPPYFFLLIFRKKFASKCLHQSANSKCKNGREKIMKNFFYELVWNSSQKFWLFWNGLLFNARKKNGRSKVSVKKTDLSKILKLIDSDKTLSNFEKNR
jgi:hypothetical protein